MSNERIPLTPAPIRVPNTVLDDLRTRLRATRFADDTGNDDWYYGVAGNYLAELVEYWADGYDWRKAEAGINENEQYDVVIDGVPVHFMRKPGAGPNPTPLILTHGWPWTDQMWTKVMGPLADPGAHGADPAEAFNVIVATLPGWGFSTPLPNNPDMNFWKTADLWHKLMTEVLGHRRYAAGGVDIGTLVTAQLAHKYADELYGIHIGTPVPLDMFNGDRAWDLTGGAQIPQDLPDDFRQQIKSWNKRFAAHVAVQVLDPSTLAAGLSDSPAGLLAWLLERWANWSDNHGDVEAVFTKDDILTNAMIYWVTNSIGTSVRAYSNAHRYPWTPSHDRKPAVQAPAGITLVGYKNPPGVTTERRVDDS